MATNSPTTIPATIAADPELTNAYKLGWNHGHGIACHNVPTIGDSYFTDDLGRVTVSEENIREVHQSLCFAAEDNSRSYSPFEYIAGAFNAAETDVDGNFNPEKEGRSAELWEVFEEGTADAIFADLAEYTDEDYGIEEEPEEEPEEEEEEEPEEE